MKNKLTKTFKSGLALALMGVIAVSSVACSSTSDSAQVPNASMQIESVTSQPPTLVDTIKIAEPSDMLQVAPDCMSDSVLMSVTSEPVTAVSEDGEEETTYQKVITANLTPVGASATFDWSVEWNENNEGAGTVVTDYLTVERVEGTINKAKLTAKKIFPNSTIKIIATAKGTGVYGTCIVSFVGLPTEINLSIFYPDGQGSTPVTLFDEDWQTEIYNFDGPAFFGYSFDNPFHYIQEDYIPNFTFDAKLVGGYGFSLTKLVNGEKDPTFTPIIGEFTSSMTSYTHTYEYSSDEQPFNLTGLFAPSSTNAHHAYIARINVLKSDGLLSALQNIFGLDYDFSFYGTGSSLNNSITLDTFSNYLLEFSSISAEFAENFTDYERWDMIALDGLKSFDYSCKVKVKSEESTTVYSLEPCYKDNKVPYYELSFYTGNAVKTLNVRFGEKITGVEINGGSIVI